MDVSVFIVFRGVQSSSTKDVCCVRQGSLRIIQSMWSTWTAQNTSR